MTDAQRSRNRPLTSEQIEAWRAWHKNGFTFDFYAGAFDVLCDMALASVSETVTPEELKRLRDIEHYAWHCMDGSEEDATTGEITIKSMREDYDKLSDLLTEGHP